MMQSCSKRISFFVFLCLYCLALRAQDTVVLSEARKWDSLFDMNHYTAFAEDPGSRYSPDQAVQLFYMADTAFRQHFTEKYGRKPFKAWMRWQFRNATAGREELLLLFHRYSFIRVYQVADGKAILLHDTYRLYSKTDQVHRRSVVVPVPPGQTITLLGEMENAYNNFGQGYPIIIRKQEFDAFLREDVFRNRYMLFFAVVFLGAVFFMGIHSFALFAFNRKRFEYLWYALYALLVFNYFLFKFEEYLYIVILYSHFPLTHKYLNNGFSYLMFFAYFRFVRSFIDFKVLAAWFYRQIRITEVLLLSLFVLDPFLSAANQGTAHSYLFNSVRIYLILTSFIGIFLLFRSRNRLSYFIATGSGLLIIGSLLAMVLSWVLPKARAGEPDPIMFMQIGILLELLCFTLGLSYKTHLMEQEKQETQQQLIGQLEQNKQLQEELNLHLEERVAEQTTRIIDQQKEIEQERELQLKLEFQKKLTEMELQLLKSQLNPHFYFNTLNNLYGLSMIAPVKAPGAILKLSDIMEYVIYDCRSEKVSLENEARFIRSYVDLEKLRYDREETIQLQLDIESDQREISPLLLIQFIENAFKHGMEDGNAESYLHIRITEKEGRLHYFSRNSLNGRKSSSGGVGMENVRKRLEMIYPGRHELCILEETGFYQVDLYLDL